MIQLEHISKKFKKKTVLNDISYTFEAGKIYGIIVGIFIVSLRDRLPSQSLVSGHIRSGFPDFRLNHN